MFRYNFKARLMYNEDETGLSTVHKPSNVIPLTKAKEVGQVTSIERGSLVIMMSAVKAVGNSIPPFLIFSRVH